MNIENKLLEILKVLGKAIPEQISYELKVDLVKKTNEALNYTHSCKSDSELLFAYEKFLDSEVNDSDVKDNINAFLSK